MTLTKSSLLKLTKADLMEIAGKFSLKPAARDTKAIIISSILNAQKTKTAAKKSGKKAVGKNAKKSKAKTAGSVGKKASPKKAVKAVVSKKPPAEKPALISQPPLSVKNEEEVVEESKFHVAEEQETLETDNGLPESYRDNRIYLLVRDPFWVFAFWDVHPETPSRLAMERGVNPENGTLVIRVFDVTDIEFDGSNAHGWFDIEPNAVSGSWYINVPADDRSYIASIGYRSGDGAFVAIASSGTVTTPRASVSDRSDEEWMTADEQFWKMYALSAGFGPGFPGGRESVEGRLMDTVSSGGRAALFREMQKRLVSSITSSAPASEAARGRDMESVGDDFPFRLECELVVYGATRPDAEVTLKGEKINLRGDGSFTARFALPDGLQIINAEARSADGKYTRTITPTVSRSTASFSNAVSGKKGK